MVNILIVDPKSNLIVDPFNMDYVECKVKLSGIHSYLFELMKSFSKKYETS